MLTPNSTVWPSQVLYAVFASIRRRNVDQREHPMMQLCSLADARIDMDVLLPRAASLKSKSRCCLGNCVWNLVRKIISPLALFTSSAQAVIRGLAHSISHIMSVAGRERKHNQHKKTITPTVSTYAGFAAVGFLEDFRTVSVRHALAMKTIHTAVTGTSRYTLDNA